MGWIPKFVSWLDSLGTGAQGLVLLGIPVMFTMLVWSVRRGSGWAYKQVRLQMASRNARLSLLEPKARLGLIEVYEAEPKAMAGMTASIYFMTEANARFQQNAQSWTSKVDLAQTNPQREKLFVDLGKLVRNFADDMNKGARDYKIASGKLADCWSSRMYWHDQRQSGNDIIQVAPKVEEIRKQSLDTAGQFLAHKEKIVGLRGWTKPVDQACDRYCDVVDDLNTTVQKFNVTCLSVEKFYKERSGVRGLTRRFWAALRFWAR